MIRALPNLISLARLCLVPVALLAIWHREYERALLWCAVAGITDALDGFLARRLNAVSRAGAYLDPIADKLLLSGAYLAMGWDRVIPWWLTAVVFGRDAIMLIAIGGALLFTKLREFPPTVWGKLSTAIQIVTALIVLVRRTILFDGFPRELEWLFIYITVIATLWSAAHYLWVGTRMVRTGKPAAA